MLYQRLFPRKAELFGASVHVWSPFIGGGGAAGRHRFCPISSRGDRFGVPDPPNSTKAAARPRCALVGTRLVRRRRAARSPAARRQVARLPAVGMRRRRKRARARARRGWCAWRVPPPPAMRPLAKRGGYGTVAAHRQRIKGRLRHICCIAPFCQHEHEPCRVARLARRHCHYGTRSIRLVPRR